MPKRYRKYNVANGARIAGKVSCVGLLLLMFLLVNPLINVSANALEDAENNGVLGSEDNDIDDSNLYFNYKLDGDNTEVDGSDEEVNNANDGQITTLPDTNTSIVGISFSPVRYYASLSPTTSAGQSAKIDITATVSVYNSGGYTVYLKSNDARLVGTNPSNTIAAATTAKTYTDMDVNTWGYASAVGTEVPVNATYKAVSVSGNGDEVAKNDTGNNIDSDTRTIALSFATKINDQKPADTYSNTMMLSVVSSPMKVTITYANIEEMQQMTSAICAAAPDSWVKQLKDTRDGKYYWVGKLPDGNCWMTQNLDLDLTTGFPLSSTTSDLGWDGNGYPTAAKTWNPPYTTAMTVSSSTIFGNAIGTRSWSLGNYRITKPTANSACGGEKNSAADCASQFTDYPTPITANNEIDAHYTLGNHYQWNAATAGTGGTITSGQASDSICPRNWKLPISGSTAMGSFGGLTTGLTGTNNTEKLTNLLSPPYYFVRGGTVSQNANFLFSDAGSYGRYWTSTPQSTKTNAYHLYFGGTNTISPSAASERQDGHSVRGIAR